jgi:hypothetical protein
MSQRQLTILFAVSLAVLGLALWLAHREQHGSGSIAGATVLPGLAANLNAITEVRITGGGGKQVTLIKGERHWQVHERGYPADSGKLRKLLIDLGNLKAVARKTRLASNYPVLGVQPVSAAGASGVRIEVLSPKHTWSLIVGHSAAGSGSYVRVSGHKQSLLAAPLVMAEADPAQWLEPIIVDLHRTQMHRIEERPWGGPSYVIERAKPAGADLRVIGIPPGRKLSSPGAADPVASALSNLTLSDVQHTATPPKEAHWAHAVFTTFDGLTVTVSGYQVAKGDPHYIELSASSSDPKAAAAAARINARTRGWQYRIPGYSYQQIFQSLAGLLQPLRGPHPHPVRRKPAA